MNIVWKLPNFVAEVGEYFKNDETKKFFHRQGLDFDRERQLIRFMREKGSLREVTKEQLLSAENLDVESKYFDKEYRKSLDKMRKELRREDSIELPAPILFRFGDVLYVFAGNRRITLAVESKLTLKSWVVDAWER